LILSLNEISVAQHCNQGGFEHCSLEARQDAVREAARMLKSDGLLIAAGINLQGQDAAVRDRHS
jgi:predicted N-formylglutamate amidohydrolase